MPALRVIGWVFYGLTLADSVGLIAVGAAGITPAEGWIVSAGLLGTVSNATMTADALVTWRQALAAGSRLSLYSAAERPRLAPVVTPGGIGLAGSF